MFLHECVLCGPSDQNQVHVTLASLGILSSEPKFIMAYIYPAAPKQNIEYRPLGGVYLQNTLYTQKSLNGITYKDAAWWDSIHVSRKQEADALTTELERLARVRIVGQYKPAMAVFDWLSVCLSVLILDI